MLVQGLKGAHAKPIVATTSPPTHLWLKVLLPSPDALKAIELAFFQWIGSNGRLYLHITMVR